MDFGIIMAFAENRKGISDIALPRVAAWGLVAAALWPLLTAVDNGMRLILCPRGAICGLLSVSIARRAACTSVTEPAKGHG